MRTVTWAEPTTLPVWIKRLRLNFRYILRRTPQVSTYTQQNDQLRLAGTVKVVSVFRLLRFISVLRIFQPVSEAFQSVQHVFGTAGDIHRLTAPFSGDHCTWLNFADIDLRRSTCCLCFFAWHPGLNEGHRKEASTDSTDTGSSADQQSTPGLINAVLTHYHLLPSFKFLCSYTTCASCT